MVSDQVIQDLVSYYLDHVEALPGRNAVDEKVAVEANELVECQRTLQWWRGKTHMFRIEHAVLILEFL